MDLRIRDFYIGGTTLYRQARETVEVEPFRIIVLNSAGLDKERSLTPSYLTLIGNAFIAAVVVFSQITE
jgi:hypothetical protein